MAPQEAVQVLLSASNLCFAPALGVALAPLRSGLALGRFAPPLVVALAPLRSVLALGGTFLEKWYRLRYRSLSECLVLNSDNFFTGH